MTIYTSPGFTFAGQIGYSKEEIDQRLQLKANAAQVFNKEEVSERFAAIEAATQTALALLNNSVEVKTLTADLDITKKFNLLDPSGGSFSVFLPFPTPIGSEIIIKNTGSSLGDIFIDDISKTVNNDEVTRVVYDGTNWVDISNTV